jgi:ATP-dependent helicase YprA (DUF1998 family)
VLQRFIPRRPCRELCPGAGEREGEEMKKNKSDILSPMDGVYYLMDETYLSNVKNGKPPVGEPVELQIFVERFVRKQKRRFVHEFTAATEEEVLAQLEAFASRSDVTLVEEKTRKPIPKDWLQQNEKEFTL